MKHARTRIGLAGLLIAAAAGAACSNGEERPAPTGESIEPELEVPQHPGEPPAALPGWEEATLRQRLERHGFGERALVHPVDVDGDGDDEFVIAGRNVALIDDTGGALPRWVVEWKEPSPWSGDEAGIGVATRSFDGNLDGKEDILVLAGHGEAILLDAATGAEHWRKQTDHPMPVHAALFDADEDGVPDFALSMQSSVYSGRTGEKLWTAELPERSMVLAPIAGNFGGKPGGDLLLAVERGGRIPNPTPNDPENPGGPEEPNPDDEVLESLFLYEGDGTPLGTFATRGGVTAAAAADFDGDGIDEVLASTNTGRLYLFGTEGLRWEVKLGEGYVERLIAGDTDGDGEIEIYCAFAPYAVDLYPSILALGATGEGLWTQPLGEPGVEVLRPEDLDGDGDKELVVATAGDWGYYQGRVLALETGAAEASRIRWEVDTGARVVDVVPAVRDGELLLLVGTEAGDVRSFEARTGEAVSIWLQGASIAADGAVALDIDGDGVDELAYGDGAGNLHLVRGDGTRVWARRSPCHRSAILGGVAAGDLDGDGTPELAVAIACADGPDSAGPGSLQFFAADGKLRSAQRLPEPLGDVAIADVDGDGAPEVLVTTWGAACGVDAYRGDGTRRWRTPVRACGHPRLDTADMDGDGAAEIAYGAVPAMGGSGLPGIAVLDGDGTVLWEQAFRPRSFAATRGGILVGEDGARHEFTGYLRKRAFADGAVEWEAAMGPLPDPEHPELQLANMVNRILTVPDADGDGIDEVVAGAFLGDVRWYDGATGAEVWATRVEAEDVPGHRRHDRLYLAWVPGTESNPPFVIAAQSEDMSLPDGELYALSAEGDIVGSLPLPAPAFAIAVGSFGGTGMEAFVGAGTSFYAVEAKVDGAGRSE